MKYILEGDEKELGRVLREQRIRIGRGLIKNHSYLRYAGP